MTHQAITTADELDALIKSWETDVSAISSNISLLRGTLCFQLFRDHESPGGRTLTGITAEKVPAAIIAVKRMDTNWARLQTVVSDARKAFGDLPRWGQAKAIAEIVEMFTGESITLEVREIPLRERTATSGTVQTIKTTPTKVKAQIHDDFTSSKNALVDVDAAWELILPQLETARSTVTALQARFAASKLVDSGELVSLTTRFNSLDTRYKCDPLGCPKDIAKELQRFFTAVESKLNAEEERIKQMQERIRNNLQTARDNLDQLKKDRVRALELYQAAVSEVDGTEGLQTPGSTKDLVEWIDALDAALLQSRFESVHEGTDAWYVSYNAAKQAVSQAITANQLVLTNCAEIKRRWTAAKLLFAQHQAKLPESKALHAFDEKAQQAMTGKIKLKEADEAVHSYEVKLGEMIARLTAGT